MLNSPSHDVVHHTMLQKSGAKIPLLFELSKGFPLKINIYFNFSVKRRIFFFLFFCRLHIVRLFFIVVAAHKTSLLFLNEANSLLQAIHEFFKIFFVQKDFMFFKTNL